MKMESAPLDLLPTALFSPSKAAAQRAQAQEWQQVDVWLSTKYQGRSVPQFERNEETLKILLALSAANERADEERELFWSVERETLVEAKGLNREQNINLISVVEDGLDAQGKEALETLADISRQLECITMDSFSIADSLCDATQTSQLLAQQSLQLSQMQKSLENELGFLCDQLQDLKSPAFQPVLSLQRQTLEWNRNTKQLRSKLAEYSDRLSSLQATDGDAKAADVHQLVSMEGQIAVLKDRIALTSAKHKAYEGLPKNRNAAVDEVRNLDLEVLELQTKLNVLFEQLIDQK